MPRRAGGQLSRRAGHAAADRRRPRRARPARARRRLRGTLGAEERQLVERALAQSAELREELALLRQVSDAVVESTDSLPEPDPEEEPSILRHVANRVVKRPNASVDLPFCDLGEESDAKADKISLRALEI